jgi:hypothetical protein
MGRAVPLVVWIEDWLAGAMSTGLRRGVRVGRAHPTRARLYRHDHGSFKGFVEHL